mgnify:CR=1 FL=1
MVKALGIGLGLVVLLALALPLMMAYMDRFSNPGVIEELRREPDGERARKVMVLTLPSGRVIPVNYLREGARVYAGADGRWWRELVGDPKPVELLVRGERLEGLGRAVRDDPDYTKDVFARLRPKAVPGFGTLIEIRLDPDDPPGPVTGSP